MRESTLLLGLLCTAIGCRTDKSPFDEDEVPTKSSLDEDGDGFAADEDCNDNDDTIYPSAEELCDDIDNDCDGDIDEDLRITLYSDSDGDGFGNPDVSETACQATDGWVQSNTDCDDEDGDIFPDADERCDDIDNDCDGDIDEGVLSEWYADADDDGYGDPDVLLAECNPPSGYVSDNTDCDDGTADVNPSASEVCNDIDDDCDTLIDDEDADLIDATTWYIDYDSDGFGSSSYTVHSCDAPTGYVGTDDDCDDTDASVYPSAPELYDDQDNDCDGAADEDLWTGTGIDGSLSVSTDTHLSTDASGTRSEPDAVAYGLLTISGSSLTLDADADGLSTGDEVMIINLQGSSSQNSSVGNYEFAHIVGVSGDQIELAASLSKVYGENDNSDLSDQIIIVQRVPHYTDVDVYAGATLTTSTWNGEVGAVLAFRATGTVWVEEGGSISVSAMGYAGGDTGTNQDDDGYQGESVGGQGIGGTPSSTSVSYNEVIAGYLANDGGGGCNVTGGGGEYGGGATGGDAWYPGLYTAPDAGTEYGDSELAQLFMGSGGGGVWNGGTDTVGEDPGPGGHGGGILYFGAATVMLDGQGAVASEGGTTDHWAAGTFTYGAGGGAGGSVIILADSLELVSDAILAEGGLGQSSYIRAGGDGGDGRVRIDCHTCGGYAQGTTEAEAALDAGSSPAPGHSSTPE